MRNISAVVTTILSASVAINLWAAESRICARNYTKGEADFCAAGGARTFAYLVPRDRSDKKICSQTYADKYCKDFKGEFTHALARDGRVVCIVNFNQPATGNYCSAQPEMYAYVVDPWELPPSN